MFHVSQLSAHKGQESDWYFIEEKDAEDFIRQRCCNLCRKELEERELDDLLDSACAAEYGIFDESTWIQTEDERKILEVFARYDAGEITVVHKLALYMTTLKSIFSRAYALEDFNAALRNDKKETE